MAEQKNGADHKTRADFLLNSNISVAFVSAHFDVGPMKYISSKEVSPKWGDVGLAEHMSVAITIPAQLVRA